MDSNNINYLLKNILCNKQVYFSGVYASDQIPKSFTYYPACFVVNIDPSNLPGTHWVCYYFPDKSRCEFFDSYGKGPNVFNLPVYSNMYHNTIRYQSDYSNVCGQYCIYYLYWRSKGHSPSQIKINLQSSHNPDNLVTVCLTFTI